MLSISNDSYNSNPYSAPHTSDTISTSRASSTLGWVFGSRIFAGVDNEKATGESEQDFEKHFFY
jgi:hypothetical protein